LKTYPPLLMTMLTTWYDMYIGTTFLKGWIRQSCIMVLENSPHEHICEILFLLTSEEQNVHTYILTSKSSPAVYQF